MSLLMPARYTTLLQRALHIDLLTCLPMALLLLAAAAPLGAQLGLPAALLRGAGAGLLAFTLLLAWLLRMPQLPRLAIWSVIETNLLWVAGSAWLLFFAGYPLTALGQVFIVAQALFVLAISAVEIAGLRRYPFARSTPEGGALPVR